MDQLNLCAPITIGCHNPINHIAFDGCAYYCTINRKCEIIKLNDCLGVACRYCTCREYDHICYNFYEHCFWASSRTCCNTLFKLDCCMNEIDCIDICVIDISGIITGISYNCCRNTLIVSFACAVIEIEKQCEKSTVLYYTRCGLITGVLSLCPGILITLLKHGKYYIGVLDPCGKNPGCHCIGVRFMPENLIFNPCGSKRRHPKIEFFAFKKCCYPYISDWDISFEALGFTLCHCNYKICEECCCDQHPCHGKDACADIIESVALTEASISHILNAEGEKLQKVLSETDDMEKILCANREVNNAIVNATHLEHVLYAKLSALTECGICGKACDNRCGQDG